MKKYYTCFVLCLTALSFTCAAQTVDTNTLHRLDDIESNIQANQFVHARIVRNETLEIESLKSKREGAEEERINETNKDASLQKQLAEGVEYYQIRFIIGYQLVLYYCPFVTIDVLTSL